MSDDVSDRIFKTLLDHWPAPLFGSDRQLQQIVDLTDLLIAEVTAADPTTSTRCPGEKGNGSSPTPTTTTTACRWCSQPYAYTLHDALTFAIRDNLPHRVWAEADDIADVAIATVADFRNKVSEDVFLDNIII